MRQRRQADSTVQPQKEAIDPNSMIGVTFHRCYRDSKLAQSGISEAGETRGSLKCLIDSNFVGCLNRSIGPNAMAIRLHFSRPVAFGSLLTFSRIHSVVRERAETPSVTAGGLVVEGSACKVYNEEAFRHFLDIERVRVARSERSFLLLLVSLRKCPELGVRVPRAMASTLFSGLSLCVREVDFIGWYRHERVLGAVLAQGFNGPDSEAPSRIIERVNQVMNGRLPQAVSRRLRVRVVQFGRHTE